MKFNVETVERKQAVLIVAKENHSLISLLKAKLKTFHVDVFSSPYLPKQLDRFDYYFLINFDIPNRYEDIVHRKATFIFINQPEKAAKLLKVASKKAKIIDVTGDLARETHLDNILWFSFSQTSENYLKLTLLQEKKYDFKMDKEKLDLKQYLSKKNIITFSLILVLFFHGAFIPPLVAASFFLWRGEAALKNKQLAEAENYRQKLIFSLTLTNKLYSLARPGLLLFSLALIPDNLIDINDLGARILENSIAISKNGKEIFKLIMTKNKTADNITILETRIAKLQAETSALEQDIDLLNQKIPSIGIFKKLKEELEKTDDLVAKFKKILRYCDIFLAKDGQKKYLLFFANNKELRPGGGFIGSFGVLTIKDFTIEELKVYDVYDADGQLNVHITPPSAITKYLRQPHWFLRDSAFSPDFLDNYAQAKIFLEKEMNFKDFSGGILFTTTAIENILGAFGDIYLPDFGEIINQKNFYLKTQLNAEKDFFPGSIQKKSFLASLMRQIFIVGENISLKELADSLKKSLDEKQMVVYLDEPEIQDTLDQFYWSGRVINPQCTAKINRCFVDYLFPYDANLGVNKANFFVTNQINLRVNIDADGEIRHILSIKFKNESPSDIYLGGNYLNYFQLLLPRETQIKSVTKNEALVEDLDEYNDQFKRIGFPLTVPAKGMVEVKIQYSLSNKITKGKGVYQLIVQKQIGSANHDFALEINLPKNIQLLSQNFSPLVKDNHIVYNTSLSADKIFLIEFIKD